MSTHWQCTSCPAQGVGQGQSHVDKALHAVIASSGEAPVRAFCRCSHSRSVHAWRFEQGNQGRCLAFEGCGCQGYEVGT